MIIFLCFNKFVFLHNINLDSIKLLRPGNKGKQLSPLEELEIKKAFKRKDNVRRLESEFKNNLIIRDMFCKTLPPDFLTVNHCIRTDLTRHRLEDANREDVSSSAGTNGSHWAPDQGCTEDDLEFPSE